MIIHIFPGDFFHITCQFIKSISKRSSHQHFFLVPVFDKANLEKCKTELISIPKEQYFIFDSSYGTSIFKLIAFFMGNKGDKLLQEASVMRALFKYRKEVIMSHFYFKSYCISPFFKNYTWVCWGNIPELNSLSIIKKFKNWIIKTYLYSRCKRLIVLTKTDKDKLINSFNCKGERIEVLNYISTEMEEVLKTINLKNQDYNSKKILLGNNTHLLSYYYNALDYLVNYKEDYIIYAMMSYGGATDDDILKFKDKVNVLFKDSFVCFTEFIPLEEYSQWLTQFESYVCNAPTQSGMGVIYRMLYLGKKVFLHGLNLDWCIQKGLKVFPLDNIIDKNIYNALEFTDKDRNSNRDIVLSIMDSEKVKLKWDKFYTSLLEN